MDNNTIFNKSDMKEACDKMGKPYYMAYEKRYQPVFSAGAERWGHSPNDDVLFNTLKAWVEENSPFAIEKSKKLLTKYPNAKVEVLDMVKECVVEKYDAALDCMGLHMLITDNDRKGYLQNAYNALNSGAPMLLFRESYRKDGVYCGVINLIEEWAQITGDDHNTPQLRQVKNVEDGRNVEVFVPLCPARAKDKNGYIEELEGVGFSVEKFVEVHYRQRKKADEDEYIKIYRDTQPGQNVYWNS